MSRVELEKAIKGTIIKYKGIIFGVDSPICIKCMDEFKVQQIINDEVFIKGLGIIL